VNNKLQIKKATIEDVPGITSIYNDAILTTTATFDTEIKTIENRLEWFNQHTEKYPLLVAAENNEVLGWASMTRWSDRSAYDDTAEISLYIHPKHRDKGIGKLLMNEIVKAGKISGLHCVLSRITQGNEKSIYLHQQVGFTHVGLLKEVGKKFGTILDVYMMQLIYS
jgi:phosphinothricin acetyltransferase